MELRHMTPIDYGLSKEFHFVGTIILGNHGELTEAKQQLALMSLEHGLGICVVPVKILDSNWDDR